MKTLDMQNMKCREYTPTSIVGGHSDPISSVAANGVMQSSPPTTPIPQVTPLHDIVYPQSLTV